MRTVLAVFDDRPAAERAIARLTETGFDRSDVHLEPAGTGGAAAGSTGALRGDGTPGRGSEDHHRGGDDHHGGGGTGVVASIGDFFSDLFGAGDDRHHPHRAHAERYAQAVRRGSHVLVVDARSDDEASRAAEMLSESGAIDIDERAQQWRSTGGSGATYNESNSATPWSGQQMVVSGSSSSQSQGARLDSSTSSSHPQVARLEQPRVGTPGSLLDSDRPALGADPYADDAGQADPARPDGAGAREARRGAGAGPQDGPGPDRVRSDPGSGGRTLDRGGVRVLQRTSERPLQDVVRQRDERAAGAAPQPGSAGRAG